MTLFHLALCDFHGPLTTLLSAPNSFLFCFFKGGLWIIAPYCEAWWLEMKLQLSGTQRCPTLSCVSVLFSNQIHKTKSLQNIKVIVILSWPLNLQGLFGASKREQILASRLVSDPDLTQPMVPWWNIRHISKLPEGWEEKTSRCECRFMLPSQPRVCLVWMRSRSSGDLSWECPLGLTALISLLWSLQWTLKSLL